MSVADFLETLARQGVELWCEGERLRFRAPKGALTEEQRRELSARKAEVVGHLRDLAAAQTTTCRLSYSQQALWFVHQQKPESAAYHVAISVRIASDVNVGALTQALKALVDRHAVLRTTYHLIDDGPVQRISAQGVADLEVRSVSDITANELRKMVEADYRRPFDLVHGPVLRASLYTRNCADHVLLLTIHHIAVDAWSLVVLFEELLKLYAEEAGGRPAGLGRPLQYIDYVNWQREMLAGPTGERAWSYWREKLAGLHEPLNLPTDYPRPALQSFCGASLPFQLQQNPTQRIKDLAREEGTTPFVVMLASFKALLFGLTGSEDLIVGTPTFGRSKSEFMRVVGDFVNSVPLRGHLRSAMTFRELVAQLRTTVVEALGAQEFPLPLLVERLHPLRDSGRYPLFDTFFNFIRFDEFREFEALLAGDESGAPVELGGLRLGAFALPQQEGQFDLAIQSMERAGTFQGVVKYRTDLFKEYTIRKFASNYVALLEKVAVEPETTLGALREFAAEVPEEERRLIEGWNATALEHDRTRCLHTVLERTAQATPDAPAVIAGIVTLSYRELDRRANQLAHLLAARGVRAGDLVAICLDRTVDMPVALAAVLKAGAAYVPLDPTHPAERLRYTLEDAGVSCTITIGRFASLLDSTKAQLLLLDEVQDALATQPETTPGVGVRPDDLAYVIYTSGSTGRPKGVQVEHRNVVNFLESMRREPGMIVTDVLLAVTTLSFDIAGLEIWLPLSIGARVVIASRADGLDGERLISLIEAHGVTILQATPATWQLMLEAGWIGKRDLKALCGGEAMRRELAVALIGKVAQLWNMYGPTETTIWSTVSHILEPSNSIPIGHPIANTRIYVLDVTGRSAPVGMTGELCIGGEGVARGYWKRPELTAEKFTVITLPDGRAERVYRTGDIARFRWDGQLEFFGRHDHQVKVRGYRIELGEIETILAALPGIKECVVTVREDHPGDQRLVAYVVASAKSSFDADTAWAALRAKLPVYMVPNQFMVLPALPLTPNGKIDRKALPTPDAPVAPADALVEILMTPAQRRVASIWCDLLRTKSVGLHDNFFDLGGHSLLLAKLHAALKREFGGELALVELFQKTTVAAQADRLSSVANADSVLKRAQARAARQAHG